MPPPVRTPGWTRVALCAVVAAVFSLAGSLTGLADGQDAASWTKARQDRFLAWRRAHTDSGTQIARIKAATAALIRAQPSLDGAMLDRAPVIWKVSAAPVVLWDGADYPEMIVVPAGEYTMGSPETESERAAIESPRHRVRIGASFAVGKYPVTVGEFARFVADTQYAGGNLCTTLENGAWGDRTGRDWRHTGFDQTPDHTAVCMNWNDARAYVTWLSKKTGHAYRLLTESEYEYANRAGSVTAYWWGDDPDSSCRYANGGDLDLKASFPDRKVSNCHDGYVFTSPVGRYQPNAFGLYDMTGNGWSWLEDCGNDSYAGAPVDGSANSHGDCGSHVLRGGSWSLYPSGLRAARRDIHLNDLRGSGSAFRVARTL